MIISKEQHLARQTFLFQFYWELLLDEKIEAHTAKEVALMLNLSYNNEKTEEQVYYENKLVEITATLNGLIGKQ
jgi:hypothetical protein